LHALANGCACFANSVAAEFFVIYSWNFDVDVEAVEQGTGDVLLIFGDHCGRTGARLNGIPEIPARTGIHCRDRLMIYQKR